MVHISLSPNLEKDDLLTALSRLFFVWEWKGSKYLNKLKKMFAGDSPAEDYLELDLTSEDKRTKVNIKPFVLKKPLILKFKG